jgi:dihydroorotate dehydrogenase electron transfer subunit
VELVGASVLTHEALGAGYHRLVLAAPEVALQCRPGQFVHVRVSEDRYPLLRRPFSVARRGDGTITLLYRVVGKGTALLAGLRPGGCLDLLGPLGSGFELLPGRRAVLVAGGAGIAPLLFLAQLAWETGHPVRAVVGAAQAAELVGTADLGELGVPAAYATDDGSLGHHGPVTDLLEGSLAGEALYACGPPAMLRKVQTLAREQAVPGQLSLEASMACGVGACRGCACRAHGGYRMVCTDGPVFDLEEVVLDG